MKIDWEQLREYLVRVASHYGVRVDDVDDAVQSILLSYFRNGCPEVKFASYWIRAFRNWMANRCRHESLLWIEPISLNEFEVSQTPDKKSSLDTRIELWDILQYPEAVRLLEMIAEIGPRAGIPVEIRMKQFRLRKKLATRLKLQEAAIA